MSRFYAERIEPYRWVVEDSQDVTIIGHFGSEEAATMVAAFLNGQMGDAAEARLALLRKMGEGQPVGIGR